MEDVYAHDMHLAQMLTSWVSQIALLNIGVRFTAIMHVKDRRRFSG